MSASGVDPLPQQLVSKARIFVLKWGIIFLPDQPPWGGILTELSGTRWGDYISSPNTIKLVLGLFIYSFLVRPQVQSHILVLYESSRSIVWRSNRNSSHCLFHSLSSVCMIHAHIKRSRGIAHSKEDREWFSLASILNFNFHVELPMYELITSL